MKRQNENTAYFQPKHYVGATSPQILSNIQAVITNDDSAVVSESAHVGLIEGATDPMIGDIGYGNNPATFDDMDYLNECETTLDNTESANSLQDDAVSEVTSNNDCDINEFIESIDVNDNIAPFEYKLGGESDTDSDDVADDENTEAYLIDVIEGVAYGAGDVNSTFRNIRQIDRTLRHVARSKAKADRVAGEANKTVPEITDSNNINPKIIDANKTDPKMTGTTPKMVRPKNTASKMINIHNIDPSITCINSFIFDAIAANKTPDITTPKKTGVNKTVFKTIGVNKTASEKSATNTTVLKMINYNSAAPKMSTDNKTAFEKTATNTTAIKMIDCNSTASIISNVNKTVCEMTSATEITGFNNISRELASLNNNDNNTSDNALIKVLHDVNIELYGMVDVNEQNPTETTDCDTMYITQTVNNAAKTDGTNNTVSVTNNYAKDNSVSYINYMSTIDGDSFSTTDINCNVLPTPSRIVILDFIENNPLSHLGIKPEFMMQLKNDICPKANVTLMDCYITLKKLRQNESFELLAQYFQMSEAKIKEIFSQTVIKLAEHLRYLIRWPPQIPGMRRENEINVRFMIDCIQTYISCSSLNNQCNSYKFMVCISKNSTIAFVSKAYVGNYDDVEIYNVSGIKNFIPKNLALVVEPGRAIPRVQTVTMNLPKTDSTEKLNTVNNKNNCTLPTLLKDATSSKSVGGTPNPHLNLTVLNNNLMSNRVKNFAVPTVCTGQQIYRILVNEVVESLRDFKILAHWSLKESVAIQHLNEIVVICSALINMQK